MCATTHVKSRCQQDIQTNQLHSKQMQWNEKDGPSGKAVQQEQGVPVAGIATRERHRERERERGRETRIFEKCIYLESRVCESETKAECKKRKRKRAIRKRAASVWIWICGSILAKRKASKRYTKSVLFLPLFFYVSKRKMSPSSGECLLLVYQIKL